MAKISLEARRALVAVPVTLDGVAAVISGATLPHAKVTTLDGKRSLEFSWEAVARVVKGNGAFRS